MPKIMATETEVVEKTTRVKAEKSAKKTAKVSEQIEENPIPVEITDEEPAVSTEVAEAMQAAEGESLAMPTEQPEASPPKAKKPVERPSPSNHSLSKNNHAFINKVLLTGMVRSSFDNGKNVVILNLVCKTGTKEPDFPSVIWYGNKAEAVREFLKTAGRHPYVTIEGEISTGVQTKGDVTEHREDIVGLSIKKGVPVLDRLYGKSGIGEFVEGQNEIYLVGKVVNATRVDSSKSSRANFVIRTSTSRRLMAFPAIRCYGRLYTQTSDIRNNDDVCVVAQIRTNVVINEETQERSYYRYLAAVDFVKLK